MSPDVNPSEPPNPERPGESADQAGSSTTSGSGSDDGSNDDSSTTVPRDRSRRWAPTPIETPVDPAAPTEPVPRDAPREVDHGDDVQSAGGSALGRAMPDVTDSPETGPDDASGQIADTQPRPSGLDDVPWQTVAEPIPEWLAKPAPSGGPNQAAPVDSAESSPPTAVAPAAPPTTVGPAPPRAGPGGMAGQPQTRPPVGRGPKGTGPDRPRRAGFIAASIAAFAIMAVGFGVIGLLAVRGDTEDGADLTTATIDSRVDPTISPATTTPTTSASVPTTAAPTTTAAATTAPSTTAPATTAPPTDPPEPTPGTVPGDLGLAEPMRRPACDGQYIIIAANAVTPAEYQSQVADALQRFVGSAYLKTDQTCPSLRPTDDLGNSIYSVYYGPFPTLAEACSIRDQVGGDSYIKILDELTPFTKIWDCSDT